MYPPLLTELQYRPDSVALFEAIADKPWAVFLDSGLHHPGQSRYDILAAQPYVRLITRGGLTEIHEDGISLSREDPYALVRRFVNAERGCVSSLPFCGGAIGYFAYDLARRIERLPSLARDAERIPEMAVGIYDWAVVVDHLERRTWLAGQGRDPETDVRWDSLVALFTKPQTERTRAPFRVTAPVTSNLTPESYARAYDRIKDYIEEGDCYQVNLAQRFSAPAAGDPWLAYQALRVLNPAPFAAYLSTPYAHILCASPERFLKVENGRVESKPIKGTRARAGHARLDAEQIESLRSSEKDRAENVMIVDLLPARFCEGAASFRCGKLCDSAPSREHGHGRTRWGPRLDRSLARCVPWRLDHRRTEAARDADHRRARAGSERSILRRDRLHWLRWQHGPQHRDSHPRVLAR
jgi:para-aminobenzoate synthetase component 1